MPTISKLLTAACSTAAGLILIHCSFGDSSVAAVSCAPSRSVALQPRWLESAFDAADIPASFETPAHFEGMPLIRALHGSLRPVQPLEPTLAFLARIVAEALAAILVVVAAVRGTSALSDSAARWLITGQIVIATCGACAVAIMWDEDAPFGSFIGAMVVGFACAAAVSTLAAVPVVVGLLPTRLLATRASMTKSGGPSQATTKESVRRDEAGAVALSRAVSSASG